LVAHISFLRIWDFVQFNLTHKSAAFVYSLYLGQYWMTES